MGHTTFQLNRRAFVRAGLLAGGALALGPAFYERAFAHGPVVVGDGPYGPLGPFDSNGIALPAGFTSREIARGGELVEGSVPPYVWHPATDGQATFPTIGSNGTPDGGWILVANSEMPFPGTGGASAVEFSAEGDVERAYRVLAGTFTNCAGGPTPWGTWLSCEEHDEGMVWECDPTGGLPAVAHRSMGVFSHEAACVDPVNEYVYLTEDEGDGCLYRFKPLLYPDLGEGRLEVAILAPDESVTWAVVPDPAGGARNPTRAQVPGATRFRGGEGLWYDDGIVYFTTKGDHRVWTYHVDDQRLHILYDRDAVGPDAPLSGVDNITVSPAGEVFVCEDGADHDICLVTPDFQVSRFLKLHPEIHAGPDEGSPVKGNETVGVVFSPDGTRMYFGAQRSFAEAGQLPRGVVYEISGPFTRPAQPPVVMPPATSGGETQDPPAGGETGAGASDGEQAVAGARSAPAARDSVAPGVMLGLRRSIGVAELSRAGLPFRLAIDEPSAVEAWLSVSGRRGRRQTVARVAPSVAVRGNVVLRLRAGRAARRALGRRRAMRGLFTVRVTDAAGNRTTVRRSVSVVAR